MHLGMRLMCASKKRGKSTSEAVVNDIDTKMDSNTEIAMLSRIPPGKKRAKPFSSSFVQCVVCRHTQ